MHVAYLALESPFDDESGGGIASYLRALVPELVARGHRVTLLVKSDRSPTTETPEESVRVVPVRLPNLHWYAAKLPYAGEAIAGPLRELEWGRGWSRGLDDLLTNDPPDLIEAGEIGASMVARRGAFPLVVRLHGGSYEFERYTDGRVSPGTRLAHFAQRLAREKADGLSAPSAFHAAEVQKSLTRHRPIEVIPNGLRSEILEAARSPIRAEKLDRVLFTGRVARVKGVEVLVGAMSRVERAVPGAQAVLAGPWQLTHKPEHYGIGASESRAAVTWAGYAKAKKLVDLYRSAAVFVMPSFYEAFCLSVTEALAFGLPVVATTAGNLPELVDDGVTGILVAPGDERAMAEAITSLLKDRTLAARMGKAARERALEKFAPGPLAETTMVFYERVVSGTNGTP